MPSNDCLQRHVFEFGEFALEVGKNFVLGNGGVRLVHLGLQLLQGRVLDVGPRLWHIRALGALGALGATHYDFLEYYPAKSP